MPSKYPDIGVIAALYRLFHGFDNRIPKDMAYKEWHKRLKLSGSARSKKIYSLKKRGYLEYSPDQEFIITEDGLQMINFAKLELLTLNKNRRDGLWRVILFDIPEQRRGARDILRKKLKEFECYTLQKSVYVTPYSCEKEINEMAKILDLENNIQVIIAKSLRSMEQHLRRHYKISPR